MSEKKPKNKVLQRTSLKISAGLLVTSAIAPVFTLPAYAATTAADNLPLENISLADSETLEELPQKEVSSDSTSETSSTSTETSTTTSTTKEEETESSSTTTSSSSSSTGTESSSSSETSSSTTSSSKIPPITSSSKETSSSSKKETTSTSSSTEALERKDLSVIVDASISHTRNQTTQEFIAKIAKDARVIGDKNGIYASVMIAQAILESSSGNSTLARGPNFNLFGIKGKYKGQSVGMPTLEDDGSGGMFSVNANFRKYPSYKESLEDYAILIKGGTNSSSSMYAGAWKANTKNYREATAYLTGRYATDTKYNQKLNGIIEAYDLQQYDNAPKVTRKVKVTRHKVAENETFWDLTKKYGTSITRIKELNEWEDDHTTLTVGKTVIVKRDVVEKEVPVAAPVKKATKKLTDKEKEKADKEELLTKEANELVLLKASQLGHAMKGAIPSGIFENQAPRVIGRQVKTNKTYTVAKNDNIQKISKAIGVPVESLVEWNNLADSLLSEGQVLVITSPFNTTME